MEGTETVNMKKEELSLTSEDSDHLSLKSIASLEKEFKYDKEWTETLNKKFNSYVLFCYQKNEEHNAASIYFSKLYRLITYPLLVLSSVITMLASLNVSNDIEYLDIYIAVLTGLYSVIHSISTFVEYGNRSKCHEHTSNQYLSLARSLESQLFFETSKREHPRVMYEIVSRELFTISQNECNVPKHLL